MDPNDAWRTLSDHTLDPYTRLHAAEALVNWLESGGFPPDGMTRHGALVLARLNRAQLGGAE